MNTFFKDIGIKNDIFGNLLELSFPYVKNFLGNKYNYENIVDNSPQSWTYKKIHFDKRISSSKFFDLYFTDYTNYNSELSDSVNEFIKEININYQKLDVMDQYISSILKRDEKSQTEFLSAFSLQLSEIRPNVNKQLATLFLNNYHSFGNYNEDFVIGTKLRLAQIITELLENLDAKDFQSIMEPEVINYKKITMILNIRYWLIHSVKVNRDKLEYLSQEINKFINKVLDGKFNLFEKGVYLRKYSINIYYYLEEIGSSDKFKHYLNTFINEENYFRILNDLVNIDYSGAIYSMNPEFEKMIDIEKLRSYGKLVQPINEQQNLLKKVFENYLEKGKEEHGRIGIRLDYPVDLAIVD